MTMQHYLTYQHNVQRYFCDRGDVYDGVIVPLSIAMAFPDGTYGFVRALCAAHSDKQYAIDPRNALFQKGWNRNSVRPPHERMAAALGRIYVDNALRRPLTPDDFSDDALLRDHVRACIQSQLQFNLRPDDTRKLEKYKKLLGLDSLAGLKSPQFLIPPYYQFNGSGDPWFAISRKCVEYASQWSDGIPIWPVVHFESWEGFASNDCNDWLAKQHLRSYWLYPNDFREHEATVVELQAYRTAVVGAIEKKLRPHALFGGYFAILLSYFGLCGFGNGVGYGEWRDSGYHKGGTAATRIYMLKLHRFLDAAAAQHLIQRDGEYFGQDTDIIDAYTSSGTSLIEMSLGEALDHFMECRRLELEAVSNQDLRDSIHELSVTVSKLKSLGTFEPDLFTLDMN